MSKADWQFVDLEQLVAEEKRELALIAEGRCGFLAPLRPTEKMVRHMMFDLRNTLPLEHIGNDALIAALEGMWAEARFASPGGGRKVEL